MKAYKNTLAAVAVVLGAVVVAPAVSHAQAAAKTGVSIGILDIDKLIQQSDAAKGIMTEMEAKRKEFEAQISKEEKALVASEQEILKQKEKLSKEEFEKKRDAFEKRLANAKKMVQDRKQTLDKAFSESMGKLRGEALKIAAAVAKERQYDLVLNDDAVVMAEPQFDMTEEVIKRLNKDVKKIAVNWAKN